MKGVFQNPAKNSDPGQNRVYNYFANSPIRKNDNTKTGGTSPPVFESENSGHFIPASGAEFGTRGDIRLARWAFRLLTCTAFRAELRPGGQGFGA